MNLFRTRTSRRASTVVITAVALACAGAGVGFAATAAPITGDGTHAKAAPSGCSAWNPANNGHGNGQMIRAAHIYYENNAQSCHYSKDAANGDRLTVRCFWHSGPQFWNYVTDNNNGETGWVADSDMDTFVSGVPC